MGYIQLMLVKNIKDMGIISWPDTCDTGFQAHFLKTGFQAISVEECQMHKFHEAKLQY